MRFSLLTRWIVTIGHVSRLLYNFSARINPHVVTDLYSCFFAPTLENKHVTNQCNNPRNVHKRSVTENDTFVCDVCLQWYFHDLGTEARKQMILQSCNHLLSSVVRRPATLQESTEKLDGGGVVVEWMKLLFEVELLDVE